MANFERRMAEKARRDAVARAARADANGRHAGARTSSRTLTGRNPFSLTLVRDSYLAPGRAGTPSRVRRLASRTAPVRKRRSQSEPRPAGSAARDHRSVPPAERLPSAATTRPWQRPRALRAKSGFSRLSTNPPPFPTVPSQPPDRASTPSLLSAHPQLRPAAVLVLYRTHLRPTRATESRPLARQLCYNSRDPLVQRTPRTVLLGALSRVPNATGSRSVVLPVLDVSRRVGQRRSPTPSDHCCV